MCATPAPPLKPQMRVGKGDIGRGFAAQRGVCAQGSKPSGWAAGGAAEEGDVSGLQAPTTVAPTAQKGGGSPNRLQLPVASALRWERGAQKVGTRERSWARSAAVREEKKRDRRDY